MFMIILLQLAFADTVGFGVSTFALRSSTGNHRQHLGGTIWRRSCSMEEGEPFERCLQYALGIGQNRQLIPQREMVTTVLQPKLLYGIRLGLRSTKVGFSAGAGVNGILGGAEKRVWQIKPGILGAIEIQRPIGRAEEKQWMLRCEASQMFHGLTSSYGIGLGAEREW